MTELLCDNAEAVDLASCLWHYFDFQLYCTLRSNDGQPSTIKYDGLNRHGVGDFKVGISVCSGERQQEALVHELLHALLIRRGYPKFWIDEPEGGEKYILAEGILNHAEHIVIKPIYLKLGYSGDKFCGPSGPLKKPHQAICIELDGMRGELVTAQGFRARMEAYLQSKSIRFTAIPVAERLAEKKSKLPPSSF